MKSEKLKVDSLNYFDDIFNIFVEHLRGGARYGAPQNPRLSGADVKWDIVFDAYEKMHFEMVWRILRWSEENLPKTLN